MSTCDDMPLCKRAGNSVKFEVFTMVTMKNGVFWDVTPCGPHKTRRFGGTYRLCHESDKNRRAKKVSSNYQPKKVG
jgi:hypothetical protein